MYFVEDLNWINSIYLLVMPITTVGYGGKAFKTLLGRLFVVIWLLDRRHRKIAKWVLHKDIIVEDLLATNINNTFHYVTSISKS